MSSVERRAEQQGLGAGRCRRACPRATTTIRRRYLIGEWGRDQYARPASSAANQTDKYFQEAEIRLRSSMSPKHCDGYEVFFRCLNTDAGYAEIVRWNGKSAAGNHWRSWSG